MIINDLIKTLNSQEYVRYKGKDYLCIGYMLQIKNVNGENTNQRSVKLLEKNSSYWVDLDDVTTAENKNKYKKKLSRTHSICCTNNKWYNINDCTFEGIEITGPKALRKLVNRQLDVTTPDGVFKVIGYKIELSQYAKL